MKSWEQWVTVQARKGETQEQDSSGPLPGVYAERGPRGQQASGHPGLVGHVQELDFT